MGAEESRPLTADPAAGAGEGAKHPSWLRPISPDLTPRAPDSGGPAAVDVSAARPVSPPKSPSKRQDKEDKPVWMRPSSLQKGAATLDLRASVDRQKPTRVVRKGAPGAPPPVPRQGGGVPAAVAAAAAERDLQEKLDNNKRELVSKISSQIKSSSVRQARVGIRGKRRIQPVPPARAAGTPRKSTPPISHLFSRRSHASTSDRGTLGGVLTRFACVVACAMQCGRPGTGT